MFGSQAKDGSLVFSCELVKIIIDIWCCHMFEKFLPVVPIAHSFSHSSLKFDRMICLTVSYIICVCGCSCLDLVFARVSASSRRKYDFKLKFTTQNNNNLPHNA